MQNFLLEEYLKGCSINYERNVDLKKKTWIHRGGIASFFISPSSVGELEQLCSFLYSYDYKFQTLGQTSNVYIKNNCDIDVVVSTIKCKDFSLDGDSIYCDSGVSVAKLSKNAISLGIEGFEYLTSLPGTVGGAIYNNSSCGPNSISSLIERVYFVDTEGRVKELNYEDFHFDFRNSDFKRQLKRGVITRIYLKKTIGDKNVLKKLSYDNLKSATDLQE